MDALPDSLRGHPNWQCAHTWVAAEELFAVVQGEDGRWTAYVPSPDGPVRFHGGIRASNRALDAAIDLWEEAHGRKVPDEFEYFNVPWVETVGLGR